MIRKRITRRSLLRENRRRLNENRFISDDEDYDGFVPYPDMDNVPEDFLEEVCRDIAKYFDGAIYTYNRYDAVSYRDIKYMMEYFIDKDSSFYQDLVGYIQTFGANNFAKEHGERLIESYNRTLPADEQIHLDI